MDSFSFETMLRSAETRLREKGIFERGDGRLSIRLPVSGSDRSLSLVCDGAAIKELESNSIESIIFSRRPGVGGMILGRPPWGSALCQISNMMPALFDEQVRQIGPSVEKLFYQTGETLSPDDVRKIARGGTVFLLGSEVLTLGYTLERAVFNLELLEKCAKSFVLAHSTGEPLTTIPWWVRLIAFRRLRRDEAKAAKAYSLGKMPTGLGGY
ncbi:hypothetical protein K2X85_17730 [bacterium]|nr:hypothetical protein [bacterium]